MPTVDVSVEESECAVRPGAAQATIPSISPALLSCSPTYKLPKPLILASILTVFRGSSKCLPRQIVLICGGCWFSPERSESGAVIRALGEDGHVAVTSLSSWPCTQTHHSASHSGPAWHLVDSHHRRPEHSLGLVLKVTDWQFLHVLLGLASVFVSLTDNPSQENLRINTYYFLSTKALCAHYTHSNAPDTRDGGVLHISPCILCTAEVSVVPRVPKELRYWLFSIHTLAGSQTQHESISVTEERWIYGEVNISFMFSGLGIGPSFPSC